MKEPKEQSAMPRHSMKIPYLISKGVLTFQILIMTEAPMFLENNLYWTINATSTGLTRGSYARRPTLSARMERLPQSLHTEDGCILCATIAQQRVRHIGERCCDGHHAGVCANCIVRRKYSELWQDNGGQLPEAAL